MNLKYYFRGLGIGITITALILIFLESDKTGTMSDAEVRKRALQLGMVENTTLINKTSEPASEPYSTDNMSSEVKDNSEEVSVDEEPSETISEEISEEPSEETGTEELKSEEPASEEPKSEEPKPEEPNSEEASDTGVETGEEYVIITVNRGDGSGTVAKRVYEAGLVEDAADYDRFLCRNGYDKRIASGNHEIKKGSTEKEIAEILCSRR